MPARLRTVANIYIEEWRTLRADKGRILTSCDAEAIRNTRNRIENMKTSDHSDGARSSGAETPNVYWATSHVQLSRHICNQGVASAPAHDALRRY
jgi:hypothetical protein